jgi:hypothetical protein
MRLFSLFMREITLIGVARMFPFSFVESTVCLHTYSLLRLLLACYRNEQPVRGDCKIASRLISRMIIQKTRASFHKTTDKTAIGFYSSLKVTGRAKIMHEHFLNCNVTWCFDFNFMVLIGKINSSQRKIA